MSDKYSAVATFMRENHVPLPERDWDNWRLVPQGVYTHKTLHLGPLQHGVTNGLIAYFIGDSGRILCVHLDNMLYHGDIGDLKILNLKDGSQHVSYNDRPKPVFIPRDASTALRQEQSKADKMAKKLEQMMKDLV